MAERHPLVQVTQIFDQLHSGVATILNAFGHNPVIGSRAAAELADLSNLEPLLTAYSQGTILIEATADQLAGFVRAITPPVLTVAPWTNIRAVLETAAIGMWLLDDRINASERIARSFAFRINGLTEGLKFARAVSQPDDDLAEPKARLDRALEQAKAAGIETITDKTGTVKLSHQMPFATHLVHDQLNEGESYRLLSAMTHGQTWAHTALGFKRVVDGDPQLLEKSITIQSIDYLASLGIKAFRGHVECKCRLFGWAVNQTRAMFDESEANLKVRFRDLVQAK